MMTLGISTGTARRQTTHDKGCIGELEVAIRAAQKGFTLSRPIIEARYDYILDNGERLLRVQVKYADYIRNGALRVPLRSECRNSGHRRGYSSREVDLFLVYVPHTDKVYAIGPDVFASQTEVCLRVEPSRNGQIAGTRNLSAYEW